jgi:hypothetical protein
MTGLFTALAGLAKELVIRIWPAKTEPVNPEAARHGSASGESARQASRTAGRS